MKKMTYADAGVDIEHGDRFANFIGNIQSPAIGKGIGGFAGGIELDWKAYTQPVMLTATDGVGTKLLVAQKLGKFDTVGIDLVAMSVNDLAVCGAFPQVFLDYIAVGSLKSTPMEALITGIVKGCEEAECILAGGETAEMADLYAPGDFDLAGFAVGLVEKDQMLPKKAHIEAGDQVFGVASGGIHSNGLSLARKLFSDDDQRAWELLLEPTIIYVKTLKALLPHEGVLGAAHITGGGLEGNIVRILPKGMGIQLTWDWPMPEIFTLMENTGKVDTQEMRKVFNMGIGLSLIIKADQADGFSRFAKEAQIEVLKIGEVTGG